MSEPRLGTSRAPERRSETVHYGRRATDRHRRRQGVLNWLLWQFPIVLVVIGFLVYSHNQRAHQAHIINAQTHALVANQRHQCTIGLEKTYENAEAWYGAYVARDATANDPLATPIARGAAKRSADDYLATVKVDMRYLDRKHSVTWPRGAKGRGSHPLGYGHYSCVAANPYPAQIKIHWYQFG